jgi:hypothetical protein
LGRNREEGMSEDLDLLQGLWAIKSLVDGHRLPAGLVANARMEVKGNRFTSLGMGAEYGGALELEPLRFRGGSIVFDVGPGKGNVDWCIYEIAQDVWKICIAAPGSVPPPTFARTPGSGFAMEVLQQLTMT